MSVETDEARRVFDAMTRECYYGLNLMIVLSEATSLERKTIMKVMNSAKLAREIAAERVAKGDG